MSLMCQVSVSKIIIILILQEELETLRVKLEKAENERSHYKNETEQLETKVSCNILNKYWK